MSNIAVGFPVSDDTEPITAFLQVQVFNRDLSIHVIKYYAELKLREQVSYMLYEALLDAYIQRIECLIKPVSTHTLHYSVTVR
jgi:hypothetical protein